MKIRSWLLFWCAVVLVAGIAVGPAAGSVPDVRLVVSETAVSPTSPSADERVAVDFTLENSAGSASAVQIESVQLQSRTGLSTVYGEAESLGSLSAGDELSTSFSATFDEPGTYDLELVVEGVDEDGQSVTVTRPVAVDVGSPVDDIEVSAEQVYLIETDDGETEIGGIGDLIGAGGSSTDAEPTAAIEIQVSNFGAPTARDVFLQPVVNGVERARIPVADVPRNGTSTVLFETESLTDEAEIEFIAAYRLTTDDPGGERRTASTQYDYRPGADGLVLTDIRMERDGEQLSITGNAGNIAGDALAGAVVGVAEDDGISPAGPQRDYFIGTIPESDFVTFDLTATIEDGHEPETVSLSVRYSADGVVHEQTIAVPYDSTPASDGSTDRSIYWTVPIVLGVGGVLVGTGGYLWRQRSAET